MAQLCNSMTPEISNTCMFLTIARDIWDAFIDTLKGTICNTKLDHYRCIETKCPKDAAITNNYIEKDEYDFLVGLNLELNQVTIQILNKELPTLNETIFIIQAKKVGEVSCLNLKIWKAKLWLLTKGVIRSLTLLITKRLIDQGLQTVTTGITSGAFTAKNLDINGRNVRNFMVPVHWHF
ncbi:hypothetical protein AAG906_037062 [Vitis piasezkii]